MKENKGITLIALVVTIVVLLILAGVSISMLTGENGVIKNATDAKRETSIGRYKEEIKILTSGEEIDYIRDAITFEQLVDKVQDGIEAKDYVETVKRKPVSTGVNLEVQTDLVLITVKLTKNGTEIVEGEVDNSGPEEADADIFNYITNEEGKIEILGFNFANLPYEITPDEIYEDGVVKIKDMPILKFPEKIEGKDVVKIKLIYHINISNSVLTAKICGIEELIYPSTLKILGEQPYWLPDVDTIVLNDGLEEIYAAFAELGNVTSITIPSSVRRIYGMFRVAREDNVELNIEGKDSINDFEGNGYWDRFLFHYQTNQMAGFTVNWLGK